MNSLDAQKLVQKYGTHVLSGLEMGSKFDVLYQAEVPQFNRLLAVNEGLRYALKRTFGLRGASLDGVNLHTLHLNSSAQIYYSSIGGDINSLQPEIINNRKMLNITNWLSTCTEDNAKFIGVYDNRLIPLDHFIDDQEIKSRVKTFIASYMTEQAVKLTK